MELADELEETRRPPRSRSPRACCSSTSPGGSAWTARRRRGWPRRPRRSRRGRGDLRSLALLRMLRPRPARARPDDAGRVARGRRRGEPAGRRVGRPDLRVAIRGAGAYAYLCAGDFDGFERALDEVLELAGDDRGVGAGIIIGSPVAWATMGRAMVAARARPSSTRPKSCSTRRCGSPTEEGDPETASWTRGNQALLLAMRGETEAGVALARRNCELTERLGDVFSRSLALANLGATQLAAGDYAGALDSLEEAERLYREAMDVGGEMEAWRAAVRAQALTRRRPGRGGGRARRMGGRVARERGMLWSLPLALLAAGPGTRGARPRRTPARRSTRRRPSRAKTGAMADDGGDRRRAPGTRRPRGGEGFRGASRGRRAGRRRGSA